MVQTLKPDPQVTEALKRLDRLSEQTPDLAEAIAFYRAVLPVLHQAQDHVEPFDLHPQIAQRKLEVGQPILVEEELPLNSLETRLLFLHICRTIEALHISPNQKNFLSRIGHFLFPRTSDNSLTAEEPDHTGDSAAIRSTAAGQIRRAVEDNLLDLSAVWVSMAVGDWETFMGLAQEYQLDPALLSLVAQNSLKPAFRAWASGLSEAVNLDSWHSGECPLCGSLPFLTEIQDKDGERRLRCGLCGTDWLYPRLQCAFCGNRDYKTLGHITVTGEEEKYRLQTCDSCHGYMKVVITYQPTPVDLLAIEDLATLHLDLIAAERGYTRMSAS